MAAYDVKFEVNNNIASPNNKQRREAKEIIEDNLPTSIDKNSGGRTLMKKRRVRLDLQGQFLSNGIRYANLQIQLNATTKSDGLTDESSEEDGEDLVTDGGGSTTIAIVLMPSGEEIPEDIMKKAFNGSLDARKKATILKR